MPRIGWVKLLVLGNVVFSAAAHIIAIAPYLFQSLLGAFAMLMQLVLFVVPAGVIVGFADAAIVELIARDTSNAGRISGRLVATTVAANATLSATGYTLLWNLVWLPGAPIWATVLAGCAGGGLTVIATRRKVTTFSAREGSRQPFAPTEIL
ncbi:hypothetical protein ACPPVW_14245 [Leifsonia sp. McL0607]|uniref:hypothetical protein n=1 Tax=Leifsonia sp. McL0607 TaxID=3415672 RepID=UPI003CF707EE